MKIKKIFLSMLLMIVAICFCPTKVFATSTIERTTTLDVSEFIQDEENKEEGWSWNSTTNTLTLTNVNFNTGDNMSIVLPSDRDIHIVSNGNNKLISSKTVISGKKDGPGVIIFGGNGLLELNSKKELPTIDANDLLFESGTVNAIGGSIITMQTIKVDGGYVKVDTSQVSDAGWTDGLYACGSIEISSGTVDIISNRVGIFATGTGHPNPTTGIKITGGNIDVSAKLAAIYAGIHNKKDTYINTTGTIDFKDSKLGIYVYDGNLEIEKGNFIVNEDCKLCKIRSENTGVVKIAKADYTKVDEAKSKVPADLSVYTDESVKALQDALAAVVEDKDVTEQIAVNGYATSIENAIVGLKYKDADYTKVNEAKAKVPSDLSIYTDETVKTLKDALALVEEGKNITEQATVDGYADAINKAIEGLVKKNKDYKVIEGEGGTFVKESGKDISIRIDHDFTENVKVEVDGQEVDKAYYKVTKGSTIITFDDMYLNTLAVGTHQVKVTFEDGVATTTLVIKEQTKDDKNETPVKDDNKKNESTSNDQETVKPTIKEETKTTVKAENKEDVKKVKTGDDENIIGVTLLLIGSLVVLTYLRKRKLIK